MSHARGWIAPTGAIGALIADQVSKRIVENSFELGQSHVVIPDFFALTFIQNTGVAFGLLHDPTNKWLSAALLAITLLISLALLVFYRLTEKSLPITRLALALMIGGALGNILDRIRQGKVTDFFDFHIGSYSWPAFNIADATITVAAIIFILATLFERERGATPP